MNQQTAQEIILQIEGIDIDELIKKVYPDRTDLENIELTQMNLPEFISLAKLVMSNFLRVLPERGISIILPLNFNYEAFGSVTLAMQITNFVNYFPQINLGKEELILLSLANYQMTNGIFYINNSSSQKNPKAYLQSIELAKQTENLNLIQESTLNKQNEFNQFFLKLEEAKKNIENLTTQKTQELTQITTNLTTANTQANQISEILQVSNQQKGRLDAIVEQQEKFIQLSEEKTKELQKLYSDENTKVGDNIKIITAQIAHVESQKQVVLEYLKFVQSQKTFFDERVEYLKKLIGREVGASLFETFKQRKTELKIPVIVWGIAVPLAALATIAWIFWLMNLQADAKDINLWWQIFALNTLKTIPAIFLLLFTIKQYSKERNFQEEYAFKSSVALTIDAFSEKITDKATKDKFIMDSVLKVYTTPIEENTHIKTKTVTDAIKTMTETVKSGTETVKDLVK